MEILLDPSRMFNIDETGFSLSPQIGKVLGIRGENFCFEEQSKHAKVSISVLCTVGADGSLPPPMIIYNRKRITHQMASQFPEQNFAVGKAI